MRRLPRFQLRRFQGSGSCRLLVEPCWAVLVLLHLSRLTATIKERPKSNLTWGCRKTRLVFIFLNWTRKPLLDIVPICCNHLSKLLVLISFPKFQFGHNKSLTAQASEKDSFICCSQEQQEQQEQHAGFCFYIAYLTMWHHRTARSRHAAKEGSFTTSKRGELSSGCQQRSTFVSALDSWWYGHRRPLNCCCGWGLGVYTGDTLSMIAHCLVYLHKKHFPFVQSDAQQTLNTKLCIVVQAIFTQDGNGIG